jgi:2',3'-cyclic-nucleotide 2'-phosphodiesterase (5'-nucleotidase family)
MSFRGQFRRILLTPCIVAAVSLAAQPKQLTILHTNDMHAGFVPHEAMWIKSTPRPLVGGFVQLEYAIDSVRRASGVSFLLDAGDIMTGNPITERVYQGASGGALFEMMNQMGYDAWCPGNHDFDISQENLQALGRVARFPMVCANLVDDKGKFPMGNVPYAILKRKDVTLGVIGLISQRLASLVNQNNLVGLRVLDPQKTLQQYVEELRGKVDLIVALTHQGFDEDSALAQRVHDVPVIIGGHSHTRLNHPKVVNGVLIVQAGSYVENLGILHLTVDNGRITHYDGNLLSLRTGTGKHEGRVTAIVDSMQTELDREYSEVIGTLSSDWIRSDGQSAIGTFVADAQRKAVGAEVAFMNNHGIRRDLPAGPITKRSLFETLPFRNVLVTFQLTGSQLRDIVRHDLEKHPAIQIAGLNVRWKRGVGGEIVSLSMSVGGRTLDDARSYRCVANDYVVGEAPRYLGLDIPSPMYLRQTLFEAVLEEIRSTKTVKPSVLYSIERVD